MDYPKVERRGEDSRIDEKRKEKKKGGHNRTEQKLRAHVHKNQTISKIFGKCRKMDFAYILTTGRSL